MRILCLAAHPDDETLGVGGTLARHAADGDALTLVVATRATAPRGSEAVSAEKRRECLAAATRLGIDDVRFLDFPTMHLNALPAIDVNDAVAREIERARPQVVYAPPCDDLNRDHAVIFDAALVATRPLGGREAPTLYSYEIPTTTRFNLASRWTANTYVDISDFVETKLAAMREYASELRPSPHPRSEESIRVFGRERGAAVGLGCAEALMLVRALR